MRKGTVYDNIAAGAFSKMGRELSWFRKDSGLEIDFVARTGGES